MKTKITITTKKNTTQECTFEVTQHIPYPRIASWDQRWENDEGMLFSKFGNAPTGLKPEYYCALLRSDRGPDDPDNNSRLDYAGYEGNPGAIIFRGKDLGEMTFRLEKAFGRDWYARGITCPDPIREQLRDQIGAFIDKNEKALRREAIARIKANVAEAVAGAKANVKKAEEKAREALKALKA